MLAAPAAFAQSDAPTVTTTDSSSGAPSLQGPTGTLLPPLGTDPGNQTLRTSLLDAFGQTPPPPPGQAGAGPAWQFSPQLMVSEQFTTNPNVGAGIDNKPNNRGSDFITLIQPQLGVQENGDRLRVNVTYDPIGEIYAENSDYSQFRQQGSADVLATALNDLLYVDVRGNIFQQAVYGGLGPVNATALAPNQRETVSSIAASPFVSRTFGGIGSLQAGVGYIYTATDAPSSLNQATPLSLGLPYNYGSSWLATKRLFASFTSGEDYGRFQDSLSSDNNFYDGTGALANGQRLVLTDDLSYAVDRFASALGEIGYENLHYPNSGFSYVGGVWAAGARLTPNADSSLTVEWRYIDGAGAPYIYGSYQATPHIRLYGGYSQGITTFDQDQQNTLLSGQATASGAAASALVAAPLLNNAGYAGANQSLNRTKRLDVNAAYIGERDTISANFDWQKSSIVGTPLGLPSSELEALGINPIYLPYFIKYGVPSYFPPNLQAVLQQIISFAKFTGQESNNITTGVTWHHDLRPNLASDLYLGYTRTLQSQTVTSETSAMQVTAGVSKTFTETLSGRVAYAGSYVVGGSQTGYDLNDTTVTVSVTKKF